MLILFIDQRISVKFVLSMSVVGLLLINIVALFRYYDSFAGAGLGELGTLVLYFVYDGVVPYDAFHKIVLYIDSSSFEVRGEIILNQFGTLIPRFIWESKPSVLLNGGNFYSQVILGRESVVTYSPTFLGELFLIGGWVSCLIGSFFAGILLKVFDNIVAQKKGLIFIILFSYSFLLIFNLYREGLFVLLTICIRISAYVLPFLLFFPFIRRNYGLKK